MLMGERESALRRGSRERARHVAVRVGLAEVVDPADFEGPGKRENR
jgi:hypothetical protein